MNEHPDLFGGKTPVVKPTRSTIADFKERIGYRKAGPGEPKCKDCARFIRKQYSNTYFKCELIGNTDGAGTDIRAGHTCNSFKSGL